MRTPRALAAPTLAAVLAVTAVTAACSGPAADAPERTSADTEFAQMMVVHHEGAVEMSDEVADRATTSEVRELAVRVADAQGPEIATMRGWLEEWGDPAPEDAGHGGMDHGGMDMDGLSQQEAMTELRDAEGADVDRRFLELMIAHHEGVLEMAEQQRADGADPEAVALARQVVEDQTSEIAEMRDLLAGL